MPDKSNFSENDFRRFQKCIKSLEPKDRPKAVGELMVQLLPKFHQIIHSIPHTNLRTTSIADSVILQLLNNFDKTLESVEKAEFLDSYLNYLWQRVKWYIVSTIKKNKKEPFQLPIDPDTGKEIEIPAHYESNVICQHIGKKMLKALNKHLTKIENDILILKMGFTIKDPEQEEGVPAENRKKITYEEIADYLNKKYPDRHFSEDSVRMRYKRLLNRIKNIDELNQFGEEVEP